MSSDLRTRIVEEARTWVGTPFHHQARTKGVGVDCAGFVIGVGRALGFQGEDHQGGNYSRYPSVHRTLVTHLERHAKRIPTTDARPGSILLFWVHAPAKRPQHLALLTEDGRMIHAFPEARQVMETHMGPYWSERLVAAFDFNGVD